MKLTAKLLSLFLVVMMLLTAVPLCFAADNTITSGDKITFGSYPQTKVRDSELISALNSAGGNTASWTSYGYYRDGKKTDIMRYTDVSYNGTRYRGVYIAENRPSFTTSSESRIHASNGYTAGSTYWFRYEPITWRVLDGETGLLLADLILDSQNYSTGKSVNYADSTIRTWLNDDFCRTAFNAEETERLKAVDGNKAFILSKTELTTSAYGFADKTYTTDKARTAKGTDYAKAQGLWVETDSISYGSSEWRVRPVESDGKYICYVRSNGYVDQSSLITCTYCGVRPAIILTDSPSAPEEPDIPDNPDTPDEPVTDCTHFCHRTGFVGFFWKIINLFNKMFKSNQTCTCGAAHW